MKTQEIEIRLLEILPELQTKLRQKNKIEKEYYTKYYNLLMRSVGANQTKQEADAKSNIMQEPIFEEYKNLELDIKLLYIERDILIEIYKTHRAEERYQTQTNE